VMTRFLTPAAGRGSPAPVLPSNRDKKVPQPRHRLVKSTLFSIAVHGLLLVPIVSAGRATGGVQTDVVRGSSSVELELVYSPTVPGEGEEKVAHVTVARQEHWADDGGAAMRQDPSSLQNPSPRYPWEARVHGWEGTVFLQAFVTSTGQATSVQVVRSSGHPVLDETALAALRQWRFVPAHRGDQKVASLVEIPVTFKLNSSEGGESP